MKRIIGVVYIVGSIAVFIVLAYLKLTDAENDLPWISLIVPMIIIYQGLEYFWSAKKRSTPGYEEPSIETEVNETIDFDPVKRNALVSKLKAMSEPIVPVQEFLDGNLNDLGSIGCNLYPSHPGIDVFRSSFQSLLKRGDINEIYVHISEVEPDEESWPYTDRVYVFGSISREILEQETKRIQPTEVSEPNSFFSKLPRGLQRLNYNHCKVLWWD